MITSTEINHKSTEQIERNEPIEAYDFARPAWQGLGACVGMDPEIFFPLRGESSEDAREICRPCSVKEECLEFAVANNEQFGIWGGFIVARRQRPGSRQ